jgi:hypothetical protein
VIYHFYHIYADGFWEDPVNSHIDALKVSDLYNFFDNFYIGIVGSQENRNMVIEKLKELDVDFSIVAEADAGWEQVTMNKIPNLIKDKNGWVFYAHTKGSHDPSKINIAWRKSMTYHNIIQWQEKVRPHFNDDIDTIGCHWCDNAFWGGTYWWAKMSYLNSLDMPLIDNRWCAEEWIGSKNPKIIDLNPGWPAFERFVTLW